MEHNPTKIPSPLLSLVPILVLVTLLFVTIRIFGSDALSGGSQIVFIMPDMPRVAIRLFSSGFPVFMLVLP